MASQTGGFVPKWYGVSNDCRDEPEKQGKPLTGPLAGYRSLRAAGQRYRIVYRVDRGEVRVIVVAAGIRRGGDRRDIYRLAQRLVRRGLVEPQDSENT